jgi:hypothetical protein
MIASTSSLRLVHELVGLDGLLAHDADGMLEDLAFAARHGRMLAGASVASSAHCLPDASRSNVERARQIATEQHVWNAAGRSGQHLAITSSAPRGTRRYT